MDNCYNRAMNLTMFVVFLLITLIGFKPTPTHAITRACPLMVRLLDYDEPIIYQYKVYDTLHDSNYTGVGNGFIPWAEVADPDTGLWEGWDSVVITTPDGKLTTRGQELLSEYFDALESKESPFSNTVIDTVDPTIITYTPRSGIYVKNERPSVTTYRNNPLYMSFFIPFNETSQVSDIAMPELICGNNTYVFLTSVTDEVPTLKTEHQWTITSDNDAHLKIQGYTSSDETDARERIISDMKDIYMKVRSDTGKVTLRCEDVGVFYWSVSGGR